MELTEEQKQNARDTIADLLVRLADEVRSGKVEVTDASQHYPATRYWSAGKWEFFRLDDLKLQLSYFDVERRKAEQQKLEKYLEENPRAELHGTST